MFSTKNMKSRKGAMAGKTIAVAVIIIFIVAAVAEVQNGSLPHVLCLMCSL